MSEELKPVLTGDEAVDRDTLLKQEVERLVRENLKVNKTNLTTEEMAALNLPAEDPKRDFEVTLNGQTYKFPDQQTYEAQMSQTIQALNARIAQAEGSKEPPKAATNEFSKEKMAELIDKDVLAGLRYALPYIPEFRQTLEDNTQLKQALAVHQFRSTTPGFTASQPEVLAVQQSIQELGLNPNDPRALKAAYAYALSEGRIQPPAQEKKAPVIPPNYGRGSASEVTPGFKSMVDHLINQPGGKEKIKQLIESGRFS